MNREEQTAVGRVMAAPREPSRAARPALPGQKMMSVDQTCDRYNIGKTTLYKLLASGALRARKIGRRTFIVDEDAENYFNNLPAFQSEASGARAA